MGSHRRSSRSIFGLFRGYSSKVSEPRSRFVQGANAFNTCSKITQISRPIFKTPVLYGQNQWIGTPFLGGAKRFYYADQRNVYFFRARGHSRWYQNPRNKLIAVLLVSGVGIAITGYFGNLETVPYTKRTRLVILSDDDEEELGEDEFEELKNRFRGKILDPLHPQSLRVKNITQDIIDASERGLVKGDIASKTSHLESLEWEVIVVDEPIEEAVSLPGGKLVIFTGLLELFGADAEVATIVGHGVAHAVARHTAEKVSFDLLLTPWQTILQVILYLFASPVVVEEGFQQRLFLPRSRRIEMEADYIGLMLMASAGYDPRVAPQVWEKSGKVGGDSSLQGDLTTHPSGRERAQVLARAIVMEEAMDLYREVQHRRKE